MRNLWPASLSFRRFDRSIGGREKVEDGEESLLVIKTLKAKFKTLTRRIQELHSYTVPEVLALPIAAGSADYLNWMRDTLKRPSPRKSVIRGPASSK